MEYRNLGRSGLKVSPICLGTMMFGGPTDEATAARIVAAPATPASTSSTRPTSTTRAARRRSSAARSSAERDRWVLATKVAQPDGPGPERAAACRALDHARPARRACARLGTDHIDIYYLHKEDHGTPLGRDGARAWATSCAPGKIRYFGVSNLPRLAHRRDLQHLRRGSASTGRSSASPTTTRMNRMPEVEHLPACGYYGLGVVPYSPLAAAC